ncbi:putative zinc metalloprotease [Marmoricola endophyticus]|uniref:Zinc metalloprotease n=1 Tax=Marmoricola endophyticus TaxID=2040280 RepID=A0A917BFP2_9ACTN|nr:site-2 protease family protein [Marmoricola endophyticus]GGF38628.1 putative zinc metalloprotease [Marmoricola endophyticus]
MTVIAYVLGVLLFAVGVAVSIALHEFGHLIPGKLFNVRVSEYFVGFGRTIWSKRIGETEYGLKAIPLGGYCKLIGMLPPDERRGTEDEQDAQEGERVRSRSTGMFSQLMDDARSAEYELVQPGDEDRMFYRLPWWKRVIIMGSGVAVNLVLAVILFGAVFMGHGVLVAKPQVQAVSQCVIAVRDGDQTRECTSADPQSPAAKAGLRAGDEITDFNGTRITDYAQLQKLIRGNGDGAARLGVVRDGERLTLTTDTTVSARPDPDDPETVSRVGFLGITPVQETERQGPGYVIDTMSSATWQTLKTLGRLPVEVYHVGRAALGLEERDPEGPMSVVGAGRVAGEITSQQQTPVVDRFFSVVLIIAGLNLFLGLFNLVPLPPMDGGQIAPTLYEALRRGWARLRRRPDPGFVDAAKLLPLTYVMATLILVGSVVLILGDILAPVTLQ